MVSLKRLVRLILPSLLVSIVSLGIAPAFSIQAQQLAATKVAAPAETLNSRGQQRVEKKKLAEGERTPLSEEEMGQVEGEWAQALVGIAVGTAFFVAQTWQANHNAHGHPSEIHLHWRWTWRGPQAYVEFHHNLRR
jgi:hypothetical protein